MIKTLLLLSPILALPFIQGCFTPVVIGADEAAVRLNTLTGSTSVVQSSGTIFQKWFLEKIYLVKKSEFNLEMTARTDGGDVKGKDDVRVKTFDGSDVNVDVSFTFKIDLTQLEKTLKYTGTDLDFNDKWIRPYARCRIREQFGQLSTEQFYDALQRQKKADETKDNLNKDLNSHGIQITNVNIQDFRFYKQYEDKIKEKKSADQSVEKEKSKKRAAVEDQNRQKVNEQKKVEVKIAEYQGPLRKQVLEAQAKAEEKIKNAESYDYEKRVRADAEFYRANNQAKQILELGKTETEILKLQITAMEGLGGKNLVRMEYGKKLNNLIITGEPWVFSPEISSVRIKEGPEAQLDDPSLKAVGKKVLTRGKGDE